MDDAEERPFANDVHWCKRRIAKSKNVLAMLLLQGNHHPWAVARTGVDETADC